MATQLFKQNALLMAKIEGTYGTDSVPDANNNPFLVRNMSINPMEGSAVDLEYVRPWYGQDASLRVATYMSCQFDTDWVPGPNAAGTASPFDVLLRACGLSATAVAAAITGTAQTGEKDVTGTAQSGSTSSTLKLASATSGTTNRFQGTLVEITGGTGKGQIRTVTAWDSTTKVATISPKWDVTPDATSTYRLEAHIKLAAGASATSGTYEGMRVRTTGGTGSGQSRAITNYNGTYKVATINTDWGTAPDATTTYSVDEAMHYNPVSASFESVTIYYNVGGVVHKMIGCRGTFTTKLAANEIPALSFSFTGLYGGVADVAITTPTYSGFGKPPAVNSTNTSGVLFGKTFIGGTAGLQVASMSFDLGNAINYRQLVGSEQVVISDRKPKGSIQLEMTLLAFKDWLGAVKNGDTGRMYMENGAVTGQTVAINMPRVQLENPRYGESDGIVMLDLDFRALWSSGNDDVRYIEK